MDTAGSNDSCRICSAIPIFQKFQQISNPKLLLLFKKLDVKADFLLGSRNFLLYFDKTVISATLESDVSPMNARSIQRHLHIPENHFQLTLSESKQSRVSLHCVEMYSSIFGSSEDVPKVIHIEEIFCCKIDVRREGEQGEKRRAATLDHQ